MAIQIREDAPRKYEIKTRSAVGRIFGLFLAAMSLALAFDSIAAVGQTYTPMYTYSINAGAYSGLLPAGVMSQGRDGFLYSTIQNNGTTSRGTAFKMSLAGLPTTLYNFCSQPSCTDGSYPDGGLTLGADGNLYGTTTGGGSKNSGTAFRMTPVGQLTTVWNFTAGGTDEGAPWFPTFQSQDGNFWGVSQAIYTGTYGTAYKIAPNGTLTSFPFNFTNGSNPSLPAQGTDGNFYGVARGGGAHGFGTVYKLTPAGKISVLHDFAGYPSDGSIPVGILVQGADGSYYGATYNGGSSNAGTLFKISATGTYTLLHSFAGWTVGDGAFPYTGLTLGTDGNFYGSTANGGTKNTGELFQLSPSGTVTTLYSFCSATCNDGYYPETPLVQDTNGKFYGNSSGNSNGGAEFYSLDMGIKAFAGLVTWSGKVGKTIGILGQGLTGTSKVTFNGTSATFTVSSDTFLTATVPAGATTGFVNVTTPVGALKSNRKFLVTPFILTFSPTSGQAGTSVVITGTSFTGAAGVAFGGVKAITFSVDSDTQITATVPTGAKTGKIQLKTAGGTATSATDFTVLP